MAAKQGSTHVPPPQDLTKVKSVSRQLVMRDESVPADNLKFVDSLVDQFMNAVVPVMRSFDKNKPSITALFCIVPQMMLAVEKFANLSGAEKKAIVIYAVKSIITAALPEIAPVVCVLVDQDLPMVIDTCCDAATTLASLVKKTKCWQRCTGAKQPQTTTTATTTTATTTSASS